MKYNRLQDYPRPAKDTRFGTHWNASCFPVANVIRDEIPRLQQCGVKWVKLVCAEDAGVESARVLAAAGIEPVIRLYAEKPHAWYRPSLETVKKYVSVGAHYVEAGNEPNLIGEGGEWRNAFNLDDLMRQWQEGRDTIKAAGAIPMLFALSPGGNSPLGSHIQMYDAMFAWLKAHGDTLEDCAIAAHPRPLNHPLDYPFDAINQKEHPGATLKDDSTCFLVVADLDRRVRELTGGRAIPILATEHGCSVGDRQDNRYPEIDRNLHALRNVNQMMDAYRTGYIHNDTGKTAIPLPDSFFCGCNWLWGMFGHYAFPADSWTDNPFYGGTLPAVGAAENYTRNLPYERGWHDDGGTVITPPPTDPPYTLELGFAQYAKDNPLLNIKANGELRSTADGDVIQRVLVTGKRGFLVWDKASGKIGHVIPFIQG